MKKKPLKFVYKYTKSWPFIRNILLYLIIMIIIKISRDFSYDKNVFDTVYSPTIKFALYLILTFCAIEFMIIIKLYFFGGADEVYDIATRYYPKDMSEALSVDYKEKDKQQLRKTKFFVYGKLILVVLFFVAVVIIMLITNPIMDTGLTSKWVKHFSTYKIFFFILTFLIALDCFVKIVIIKYEE